jgi:hypothetical protein
MYIIVLYAMGFGFRYLMFRVICANLPQLLRGAAQALVGIAPTDARKIDHPFIRLTTGFRPWQPLYTLMRAVNREETSGIGSPFFFLNLGINASSRFRNHSWTADCLIPARL